MRCWPHCGGGRCLGSRWPLLSYCSFSVRAAPARQPDAPPSGSKTSKGQMMHFAGCWKPGLIALGTVTILSSGCARVVSDHAACPPVVAYPAAFQNRAAAEVGALPAGAAVEAMLADYHVMRRQARACHRLAPSLPIGEWILPSAAIRHINCSGCRIVACQRKAAYGPVTLQKGIMSIDSGCILGIARLSQIRARVTL